MFGWAMIGAGYAARKFALGLRSVQGAHLASVYSRSEATAHGFARDFGGIPFATLVEEALNAPGVNAAYIATPPTSHRDQALAAIAAGIPVLIEKPTAASYADARAIVDAAQAAGVFAMEGMWTRFLPAVVKARALLANEAVGAIRSLEGSFGLPNEATPSDNQFNPALGGGALLHRGVYALAMALDLAGPAELAASSATIGETGVDEDVVLTLRHESGALTVARASLRAALPGGFSVEGTHGRLMLEPPIYRPSRISLTPARPLRRAAGRPRFETLRETGAAHAAQRLLEPVIKARRRRLFAAAYAGNGYGHEAEALMAAVRAGQTQHERMPLSDSLAIAKLVEDARAAWR